MYSIQLTRQAKKDAVDIERAGFKPKVSEILSNVKKNPFEESQEFEKLRGNMKGLYSRRINIKHRFVYGVLPNSENLTDADGVPYEGIVKVISMWTHYE